MAEFEDDDLFEDEPGGDEEQEQSVDVEALRAQIEQETEARLEAKFQQDKAALFSGLKTRAQDLLGVEITDDYNFKPVDPRRTLEFAARAGTPAPQAEAEPEIPDVYTDPEAYRRWVRAEAKREAEASLQGSAVAQELATIRREMELLRGVAMRPLETALPEQARVVLSEYGMDALADDADYQRELAATVQTAIKNGHMAPGDADGLEALALMLAPKYKAKLQAARAAAAAAQQSRTRDDGGRYTPNPSRALLSQMQPSQGRGSGGGGGVQLSEDERIEMELMGIEDVREYAALTRGGEAYNSFSESARSRSKRNGR